MSGVLGGDILYYYQTDFDENGAELFSKEIFAKVIGFDGDGKPIVNILSGEEHMLDGSDRGRRFAKIGNTYLPARQNGIYFDSVSSDAPRDVLYSGVDRPSKFKDPSTFIDVRGKLGYYDDDFGWLTEDGTETGEPLIGHVSKNGFYKGNIILTNAGSIAISGFNNDAGYTDDSTADAALAAAQAKIITFHQDAEPGSSYPEGSIWFKSDALNSIWRLESGAWVEKVGPGSGFATYIDATGVYTGTVAAEHIIGGDFTGQTFTGGTFDGISITSSTFTTGAGYPYEVTINSSGITFLEISSSVSATISQNGSGLNFATSNPAVEFYFTRDVNITGNLSVSGSYGLSSGDIPDLSGTYAVTSHSHSFASLTSKPTTLAGYGITDAASSSHTHTFASLTSKPTTLAGYGITDAASSSHTHTFASLTSKPTTLAGYGITDAASSSHTHPITSLTGNASYPNRIIINDAYGNIDYSSYTTSSFHQYVSGAFTGTIPSTVLNIYVNNGIITGWD